MKGDLIIERGIIIVEILGGMFVSVLIFPTLFHNDIFHLETCDLCWTLKRLSYWLVDLLCFCYVVLT